MSHSDHLSAAVTRMLGKPESEMTRGDIVELGHLGKLVTLHADGMLTRLNDRIGVTLTPRELSHMETEADRMESEGK